MIAEDSKSEEDSKSNSSSGNLTPSNFSTPI